VAQGSVGQTPEEKEVPTHLCQAFPSLSPGAKPLEPATDRGLEGVREGGREGGGEKAIKRRKDGGTQ